jgi:rhamnose utilization protein RhaD (predicted bifunctional aldolase and dehydrogenase)
MEEENYLKLAFAANKAIDTLKEFIVVFNSKSLSPLKKLEEVSNFYGSNPDYVLGGGGNTSYKDEKFLYIKPSGTSLAKIKDTDFIKMDRRKIRKIFELGKITDSRKREALALKTISDAIAPDFSGRPSVETPLHEFLPYSYVVHMHPAAVNGMTCGKKGKELSRVLFPEALWIDYVDPGMTLACRIKEKLAEYEALHYRSPQVIFLKNHGVFAAADSTDEIKSLYTKIMGTLSRYYAKHRIAIKVPTTLADSAKYSKLFKSIFPKEAANIVALAYFKTAEGPLTPDHIVYCKSFTLKTDKINAKVIDDFKKKHGYLPKVIELKGKGVFCLGETPKDAELTSMLTMDASKILKFAEAFGSSEYLTEKQRLFIENWEAETYRKKQTS